MHRTLIDAPTLRAHLDDPAWLLLDARHALADFSAGRRAYEAAHLPGAFFADMEQDLAGVPTGSNGRHPLPEREAFAAFLRRLGATDETQLIAYDAGADMFAARLWMMARWIGHEAVALLDGGFAAWIAAGFPTVGSEEARSISLALASVRRSNRTCSFPASGFHEWSLRGLKRRDK